MIVGTIASPGFLTAINLRDILNQAFLYIILTLGQIFVIILGNTDLSMSTTMIVAGLLGLTVMNSGPDVLWSGLGVMLAFGLLIGTINTLVVVIGKMNPLLATYALSKILQGFALSTSPRPLSPSTDIFKNMVKMNFTGFPLVLFVATALILIMTIILKHTPLGR